MQASADVGRTFGRVAAAYERTRPEYPAEAVERVAAELSLALDATVLDLGAGTGKLTRRLRGRFTQVIAALSPPAFRADLDAIWARFHPLGRAFPDWRERFAGTRFGPPGDAEFPQTLRISGRDLVDLWLTSSTPASIPESERAAVAPRAYPLMEAGYTLRFATVLHWTRLA